MMIFNSRKLFFFKHSCLAVLAVLFVLPGFGQKLPQTIPSDLDKYVEQVLKTFNVPGLSLAIVKDNKVLLTKGYGVRKLGESNRVDEHTLFPIASNSKAFTATALALLVEEGKLEWDKPVVDYLPWFRMSDPFVTNLLSVRDLLVHRSGLAPYAGDLLQFPPSTYTRRQLVEKLRYLPLSTSFRSTYAYDNVLYLVAGEVIKEVSGLDWEAFVKSRILDKVGMSESLVQFSKFEPSANRATSHAPVGGKVQVLESFFEQGLGDISDPAGGIVSNAADMSKWLLTQLDSGRIAGGAERLFSAATTNQLWKPVTPMPVSKYPEWLKPAQQDLSGYALGFRVYTYRGAKVVTHGGKLDGFVSFVKMVPDLDLGIAILTNQESGNAYASIINHIADHFMGAPAFDWIAGYRKSEDIKFKNIANVEQKSSATRNKDSKPSLALDKYVGMYEDQWYGSISIKMENNHPVMRFEHTPQLVGDMQHYQYDTFIVNWRNKELRADAYVTFSLNPDGSIDHVKMKAVSPITDVSFDFHDLMIRPVK